MSDGDERKRLMAALGRLPSGLFVLTARHGEAETGMLASWVQQCSFEPPQISVALQRDRPVLSWLTAGAAFTLNILDDSQTDMIAHFGRGFALDEPAFMGLDVERVEVHGHHAADPLEDRRHVGGVDRLPQAPALEGEGVEESRPRPAPDAGWPHDQHWHSAAGPGAGRD